ASDPNWPLFIAANRDEFHHRPALPAKPWPKNPNIIAGIDCLGHGSWLGMTRQGRFALLTNYRDASTAANTNAPSRGELVGQYLQNNVSPQDYSNAVQKVAQNYNGYNLIVGDLGSAWYSGNRTGAASATQLAPGRYVLTNHLLDTPWPKAQRLRNALDALPLSSLAVSLNPVFDSLKDDAVADDHLLPQTGLSLDKERLLSSPFIISPDYGTRCSSVIAIHASGQVFFSEVSYDPTGTASQRHDWPFTLVK
ncbi:NRDE family protein, partial [Photobacterium phosphoreum]|uniref:NRDE family protein n=1 Tax=Photobacterium phosphoreum TaxID=659 RepID=UPI001E3821D2